MRLKLNPTGEKDNAACFSVCVDGNVKMMALIHLFLSLY